MNTFPANHYLSNPATSFLVPSNASESRPVIPLHVCHVETVGYGSKIGGQVVELILIDVVDFHAQRYSPVVVVKNDMVKVDFSLPRSFDYEVAGCIFSIRRPAAALGEVFSGKIIVENFGESDDNFSASVSATGDGQVVDSGDAGNSLVDSHVWPFPSKGSCGQGRRMRQHLSGPLYFSGGKFLIKESRS